MIDYSLKRRTMIKLYKQLNKWLYQDNVQLPHTINTPLGNIEILNKKELNLNKFRSFDKNYIPTKIKVENIISVKHQFDCDYEDHMFSSFNRWCKHVQYALKDKV